MSVTLASRVKQIPKPATLAINARVQALQAAGTDIINLSVGEPDFPTPQRVCQAAVRAMDRGFTRYTAVQGILPLREAIAVRIARDYGVTYTADQVTVGNGGKQCLYNLFQVAIDPGDEVIIPAPYWLTYPPQVVLAQGVPVFLHTRFSDGFQIDPEALEAAVTTRTRALVINSPSNPTGVAYRADVLKAVADIALRHNLLIVSDDLYYNLVYEGFRFQSVVSLSPEVADRTVIVGGFSKAYAMTGWRLGYALGPRELISAMNNIQGQSTSNPNSLAQNAGVEALNGAGGDAEIAEMLAEFQRRRDRMMARLREIPGIECLEPQGAFYTFPRVAAYYGRTTPSGQRITDSLTFAGYLLDEARVACVPGIEFGNDEHVRFSYACAFELLDKAMDRVASALARLA